MSGIIGYFTTSPVVLMGRSQVTTTTTTTTAAPACAVCSAYTVTNDTEVVLTYYYYACDGSCTYTSGTISGGEGSSFCNCDSCGTPPPVKGLTITYVGNCP
jgi:hypothetical protein